MPLEHIALRANAKQPRPHTEIKFSNSSERAHKWCRADSSVQLRQQLSDAALRWVAIQTSQHNIKKKKKEEGGSSQGKSCRMRASNKLAGRGVKSENKWEGGKEGGVKKRKGTQGTPLTLLSIRHRAPEKLLWLRGLTPQCPFNYCSWSQHSASGNNADLLLCFSKSSVYIGLHLLLFLLFCFASFTSRPPPPWPPPPTRCNPHLQLNVSIFLFCPFSITQQPPSPQERDDPNSDHEAPQPMSHKS